jgi:ketosteroid isomerase-like protein
MSRENLEVVRRAYEAWNRRDVDEAAELLAPDIEWQMPPNLPDAETWRSSDEVTRGLETFLESWTELRVEVHELIDAGDRVVALVRYSGQAALTGLEVEGAGVDAAVWTLRDGRATKVQMYGGTDEALAAVGLRQ